MEILGLDKIKQMNENSNVEAEVGGLGFIKQIESHLVLDDEHEEKQQRREEKENQPVLHHDDIGFNEPQINVTGLEHIRTVGAQPQPKMSSFAVKLIQLVNQAKELDAGLKVFGADKHMYKFNPVIQLSKVRDFERRHKITLPEGYVDFLTQVGDGGAGPDLGLYSLDEVEFNNYTDHSPVSCSYDVIRSRSDYYTVPYVIEGKEPLINSQLTEDKWFEWYENLGKLSASGKDFKRVTTELYNGMVEISAMGGTNAMYLICTGDLKGQVAAFMLDIDDKVHLFNITFEEWMLGHFQKIIANLEKKK